MRVLAHAEMFDGFKGADKMADLICSIERGLKSFQNQPVVSGGSSQNVHHLSPSCDHV